VHAYYVLFTSAKKSGQAETEMWGGIYCYCQIEMLSSGEEVATWISLWGSQPVQEWPLNPATNSHRAKERNSWGPSWPPSCPCSCSCRVLVHSYSALTLYLSHFALCFYICQRKLFKTLVGLFWGAMMISKGTVATESCNSHCDKANWGFIAKEQGRGQWVKN
jgi:hypothetical protein